MTNAGKVTSTLAFSRTLSEFIELAFLQKNVIIFTTTLREIYDLITESDLPYACKIFEYKDKCYSLTIIKSKNNELVLKDYYHFLPIKEDYNMIDKYYNILLLYTTIKREFNIDIGHRRILSISSIAFNIFKQHKDLYKQIANLTFTQDDFIRKSYIGGRTEIYKPIHMKESYYYDVNSLYPYVMANMDMPVGVPIHRPSEYFKANKLGDFFGFVEVLVRVPNDISLCVLGINLSLEDTGIVYPKGILKGVYFSEELKLAISKGYKVLQIYRAYEFKKAIIFKKYVDKLYELRVSSKGLLNHIYKKLLNTLYGRFGCVYSRITPDEENDIELTSFNKYMNVGIASAITSYARIYMYKIIEPLYKHLLYIDTDGIFLDCKLDQELVQNKLGYFKLVSENSSSIFYGTKFYMYKPLGKEKYIKVFRGLPVNKYQFLVKDMLSSYVCSMKDSKNKQYTTIEFNVLNKDTQLVTRLQRIFFNKRIIYYNEKERSFNTKPWTYKAIKVNVIK
jgi:hypothetical protein